MRDFETLIYWIVQREAIRIKKERGDPFPWTDDEILCKYRFCCVRREDDRVTRWIRENIREPFADHPHLWFMLCAARMINWPMTLAFLMVSDNKAWPSDPSFTPSGMADELEHLARIGRKVFTGAYIIPAPSKGGSKGTFIAQEVLGRLWRDRARFELHFSNAASLRTTHMLLTKYDFWGPFLAYQAVVDMRFTRLLSEASDVESWCAAGPGTIRGLNRLHGNPVDHPMRQDSAMRLILDLRAEVEDRLQEPFELSDVPNVLCEFDKYMRVKNGEGKPRAGYVVGRGS